MTIDKAKLKALVERVTTDRRFCADEHHRELATGVSALLAEIERLAADEQEATTLCSRLSDLLRDVALAVRGPEEPLKRHGFADLPSRVKVVVAERDQLKAENEALRKALGKISVQVDENIRCAVRDVVNGLPDVQDIYGYCDNIDEIIAAAMAKEASHD